MFGIVYANQTDPSWCYKYCYLNNDNSKIYTLNKSGTALTTSKVGDVVHCGRTESDIKAYGNGADRILTCTVTTGINNNEPYWKIRYSSCSLNELASNSKLQGVTVNIPYNGNFITLQQAMSSGYGGQERMINTWGITLTNTSNLSITCSGTTWTVK